MKFSILSCSLLACILPLVSATALTYKLEANERACFYSSIEHKGAKIAFYYAVRILRLQIARNRVVADTDARRSKPVALSMSTMRLLGQTRS